MRYVSWLYTALFRYPLSSIVTALTLIVAAFMANWPLWLPYVLWAATSLLVSTMWEAMEPFILRLWGCRSLSARERWRLEPALQQLRASVGPERDPVLLVDDRQGVGADAGLRTITLTRGALEALDGPQLAGLLAHEVGHLCHADALARLVMWVGNAPLVACWLLTRALRGVASGVAVLLAVGWLFPALAFGRSFLRVVRASVTVLLVAVLSLYTLGAGISWHQDVLLAAGFGLLGSWLLVPGMQLLLAWEGRGAEQAADRFAVEAGLGQGLLGALRVMQSLESVPPGGPLATLRRTHPPTELRLDALERLLDHTAHVGQGGSRKSDMQPGQPVAGDVPAGSGTGSRRS